MIEVTHVLARTVGKYSAAVMTTVTQYTIDDDGYGDAAPNMPKVNQQKDVDGLQTK